MQETKPTPPLSFRWSWRPYQKRVLDAVGLHLADRRLHVVAAPGAGKTTLGLEVFRGLDNPALVLSPTRGIRDQWVHRLNDFLPPDAERPLAWVSRRLDEPRFFTSVTYQALHTRYREADEDEDTEAGEEAAEEEDAPPSKNELADLIRRLKKTGVKTLIVDEAHHLRAEWWKALTYIVETIPDLTLVALTATPPYDVTGHEWRKYLDLCGPIDEQISIPELVKAGTLCPHQDFVWLVEPPASEKKHLSDYDASVGQVCGALLTDEIFSASIQRHPWVASEAPDTAEILDEPELAVALLIYLKTTGCGLPPVLLELLDTEPKDLPAIGRRWWQVLVRAYLFDSKWPHTEESAEHRDRLAKQLRSMSLLWRRELRLLESRPVKSALSLSPAKIQGCIDVYRHEYAFRKDNLHQVILTDFIRDDDVDRVQPTSTPSLGAWPIFRALVESVAPDEREPMALLTGRLAAVHKSLLPELKRRTAGRGLIVRDLPSLPDFQRVSLARGRLTRAFTDLLNAGRIRVLVGTRSLLGEGWDAPSINSLVLCSFVGSFMLTNQMRGRAIRIDRDRPDKAAGIWHLVAVDPATESGLSDLQDLQRRFESFVGLGATKPIIENGLNRLDLKYAGSETILSRQIDRDAGNGEMVQRLAASTSLRQRWEAALATGKEGRVLPSVKTEKPLSVRPFHFRKTLRYLLWEAFHTFMAGFGIVVQGAEGVRSENFKMLLWLLVVAGGVGFLAMLPKLVRAVVLWIRHLPVDGSLRQIAMALRDALCAARLIENEPRRLHVVSTPLDDGGYSISLAGADFYEQARFADCLGELLGQIENPRYLLTRRAGGRLFARMDFHAVPQLLGVKKERAELLHRAWTKRVGPAELIYTRSPDGRRMLLKARARAFSTAMSRAAERFDRWQ